MLMPSDIKNEVEGVLKEAPIDSKGRRSGQTAYQILEKLPAATKDQLIQERGEPGKGSGYPYRAASVVAQAAQLISGIDVSILDTSDLTITVKGDKIIPGAEGVGIYRLPV